MQHKIDVKKGDILGMIFANEIGKNPRVNTLAFIQITPKIILTMKVLFNSFGTSCFILLEHKAIPGKIILIDDLKKAASNAGTLAAVQSLIMLHPIV